MRLIPPVLLFRSIHAILSGLIRVGVGVIVAVVHMRVCAALRR